jgi:Na+-translocating ferredoxin:NAD+ oxidoreductase RNF subunit RnfB
MNSVTLDKSKCKGCTTCMKHCPTEAIRVRRGRAHIIKERCIDCGQCIRVCPHHAKKAVCDPFEKIRDFDYRVALPAPSLYGQFRNLDNIDIVLQALLDIGFDDVYEVSRAAEMISDLTGKVYEEKKKARQGPIISSACPAAVRLICMRFPKLIPNILEIVAPVELAAMHARDEAVRKTGLDPAKIGIFFITPCPAKVTACRYPIFLKEPVIDGSISMADIYKRILGPMKKVREPQKLSKSGTVGIRWARTGGESLALLDDRHIAVDGIDNIIAILEDIENGMLPEVDFVELNACTQGCVGGCLTVENPYIAKTRIKKLTKDLPTSRNSIGDFPAAASRAFAEKTPEYVPVWQLSDDRNDAMEKYARIEALQKSLPGLDCGSCGAPSCRALAEDVVIGFASEEDCIFRVREKMQHMAGAGHADEYLPPPFRRTEENDEKNTTFDESSGEVS